MERTGGLFRRGLAESWGPSPPPLSSGNPGRNPDGLGFRKNKEEHVFKQLLQMCKQPWYMREGGGGKWRDRQTQINLVFSDASSKVNTHYDLNNLSALWFRRTSLHSIQRVKDITTCGHRYKEIIRCLVGQSDMFSIYWPRSKFRES